MKLRLLLYFTPMNPRLWSLAMALLATLVLPACALVTVPRHTAFDEAPLAPYARAGTASVSGHIVVKAEQDGAVREGHQSTLTLLPVCAYTKEMIERELGDGDLLARSDARLKNYLRFATADDQGHFTFHGVPAGEYYLVGLVQWWDADDSQYQWACEHLKITAGQALRVQVSTNVHHAGKPYVVMWRLE